ncbi:hypothetical protein GCM10027051_12570 [Niabella terrae]
MKQLILAFTLLFTMTAFAQLSAPEQVIVLDAEVHLIADLNLDPGKNYGMNAKDIAVLFPGLIKEKKINEKFGKNAYRSKVVKVIDKKALIPTMATALRKRQVTLDQLRPKLIILN